MWGAKETLMALFKVLDFDPDSVSSFSATGEGGVKVRVQQRIGTITVFLASPSGGSVPDIGPPCHMDYLTNCHPQHDLLHISNGGRVMRGEFDWDHTHLVPESGAAPLSRKTLRCVLGQMRDFGLYTERDAQNLLVKFDDYMAREIAAREGWAKLYDDGIAMASSFASVYMHTLVARLFDQYLIEAANRYHEHAGRLAIIMRCALLIGLQVWLSGGFESIILMVLLQGVLNLCGLGMSRAGRDFGMRLVTLMVAFHWGSLFTLGASAFGGLFGIATADGMIGCFPTLSSAENIRFGIQVEGQTMLLLEGAVLEGGRIETEVSSLKSLVGKEISLNVGGRSIKGVVVVLETLPVRESCTETPATKNAVTVSPVKAALDEGVRRRVRTEPLESTGASSAM